MSRLPRRLAFLCASIALATALGSVSITPSRASGRSAAWKVRRLSIPRPAPAPSLDPPRPPPSVQRLALAEGAAWAFAPRLTPVTRAAERLTGQTERRPLTVFLHGACGHPVSGCDRWAEAATDRGWLICPTGPRRCGQAWDWSGSDASKTAHLRTATDALVETWPRRVSVEGKVIAGFSRGAFAARDILEHGPSGYVGAIFIGAAFIPDADRLRASGVRRVVFACGDHDGARPTMLKATAALARRGLPARFVSLGPIWHALPNDLGERLREPLDWVADGSAD